MLLSHAVVINSIELFRLSLRGKENLKLVLKREDKPGMMFVQMRGDGEV